MDRAAGAALPGDAGLGGGEQPLHLAELRVGLLQLGGATGEHVEPVVVADRHLVGEPAEVPRQRGDALGQLMAAAAQLGHRSAGSDETADGHDLAAAGCAPSSCVASSGMSVRSAWTSPGLSRPFRSAGRRAS